MGEGRRWLERGQRPMVQAEMRSRHLAAHSALSFWRMRKECRGDALTPNYK